MTNNLLKLLALLSILSFSNILSQPIDNNTKNDTKVENKTKSDIKKEIESRWEKATEKTQINVIGDSVESLKKIPGSATIINKKYLEETNPVDAMEVLKRVP